MLYFLFKLVFFAFIIEKGMHCADVVVIWVDLCAGRTSFMLSLAPEPAAHGSVQPRKCWINTGSPGAGDITLYAGYVCCVYFYMQCRQTAPLLTLVTFFTAKHLTLAAILYGLSVHMKIYPVTYALPITLTLRTPDTGSAEGKNGWRMLTVFIRSLLNRKLFLFAAVAGGVLCTLTALFYYM